MGRDRNAYGQSSKRPDFNPRAPYGARQIPSSCSHLLYKFQSTRPVWGATQSGGRPRRGECISIHAPRMGRDSAYCRYAPRPTDFNPRAPYGARLIRRVFPWRATSFQSTRPVWGATTSTKCLLSYKILFQSTRPVWGATLGEFLPEPDETISIHAPRMGRDYTFGWHFIQYGVFQSTRPVWGATSTSIRCCGWQCISIHAPRMGRDRSFSGRMPRSLNFNPRAPYGARLEPGKSPAHFLHFNPRAPYGARPSYAVEQTVKVLFQSTRPVWGATVGLHFLRNLVLNFNPRAPYGARQQNCTIFLYSFAQE